MRVASPWVIVVSRSASEYATADSLRRAGYRVYIPQRRVQLASWRVGELALRPQWPGYLFAQDWRGWPERHVEGEPRLLKSAGDVFEVPHRDVMQIIDCELSGAFDPAPKTLKRTDIEIGDKVALQLYERQIDGELVDLSDDGRAAIRAMILGRETVIRNVQQDELRAISA